MSDDPRDGGGPSDPESKEGWEALSEEPTEGLLSPSAELEEALREASDAVDSDRSAPQRGRATSADKVTIEALSAELASLKAEYETKLAELEDVNDRHLRLQAEFDNFRRRGLKERQEALQFGHQNLVKDLLPTVDNLERAIEHSEGSGGGTLDGLLQGVELVLRELLAALGKHGVTQIEADAQPFDPTVHEAVGQIADPTAPPNTVVQVLQKGYQLHDRMLRPARVIVSAGPAPEGQPGNED